MSMADPRSVMERLRSRPRSSGLSRSVASYQYRGTVAAKPSIGARSAGMAAWAAQFWERASWGERDMIKQELEDLTRRNAGTGQTLLALAHKVLQEEGKEFNRSSPRAAGK